MLLYEFLLEIRKLRVIVYIYKKNIRACYLQAMFLLILIPGLMPVYAQEMLGIVNSSYSGITGTVINPAVTVTSPYYIDINLITVNAFAENNAVYMPKEDYRFRRFFSKSPQFPTYGTDNLIVKDYYNSSDKKAYANLRLLGPSFSVTVGRNSFGFVTGARGVMSTKNLPYELAKFGYTGLAYPPQYDINYVDNRNIYNAELGWMESGFNYSHSFKQRSLDQWSAGISIKDLRGYAGGYFTSQSLDYTVLNKDTLIINNLDAEAGYSMPVNYQTDAFMTDPVFRGKGIGIDIGIIYEKKNKYAQSEHVDKLCRQNYVPYKYKIGVSLIDIGRIKFTDNAEKLVFNNVSTFWPDLRHINYSNIEGFTQLLSNQFYGNPTELLQGNEIKIALPTALSIQADVDFYRNWFVNGTLVYPVQLSKSGIIRPVLFAVTPRYQTRYFEASMPLTLYDWTKPRIGLSVRFAGFFLGTEKLSGYFHYKDFTGLDFYAGFKFSLHKGDCRSNRNSDSCGAEEYKKFQKKKSDKQPRNSPTVYN